MDPFMALLSMGLIFWNKCQENLINTNENIDENIKLFSSRRIFWNCKSIVELSKSAKHIYIVSRSIKLELVHDEIIRNNCECTIVPLDLCDENSIENLAKEIFSRDTFIDILVISAGIIENLSPVDSIDLDKISKVIKLNFLSSFRIIKNFHPLLRNSIEGKLAVVSSVKNNSKNQYWGIYQPIMSALNELVMTYK